MIKILVALIFTFFLASPCLSSDSIDSYVNERGQRIYTNIGAGTPKKEENMNGKVKTVVEDILSRHPEMNDDKADRMIQLQEHFVKFGNAADWALLKAEKIMIRDGILIDHEALAAEKIAIEKRRQREALELEKQLLAIQLEESNREKLKSIREKRELGRREIPAAEEEENRKPAMINSTDGSVLNRAGSYGYIGQDGTFYTKAGSHGVINTKTGEFSPVH